MRRFNPARNYSDLNRCGRHAQFARGPLRIDVDDLAKTAEADDD